MNDFLDEFDIEYLETIKSLIGKKKFLLLLSENDEKSDFLYQKAKEIINKHKQVSFETNLTDAKSIIFEHIDPIRYNDIENLNKVNELINKHGMRHSYSPQIRDEVNKLNLADYIVTFYHLNPSQIKYKIENWLDSLSSYKTKTHSAQLEGKKILNVVTVNNEFHGFSKNLLQNEILVNNKLYHVLLKKMKENPPSSDKRKEYNSISYQRRKEKQKEVTENK